MNKADVELYDKDKLQHEVFIATARLELIARDYVGTINLEETPLKKLQSGELFIYKIQSSGEYLLMGKCGNFVRQICPKGDLVYLGGLCYLCGETMVVDTGVRL